MFVLRHGQSYFNLHFSATHVDPGIEDPALTPLGVKQAVAAAEALRAVSITRLIVSPFTRALETAQPVLAIHRVPVDIMHEVRERAAFSCDVGSHPDTLARTFPQHGFAHLPRHWWHAHAVETVEETIARADSFRSTMATRVDSETTLVVSHWAFLLALTGASLDNGEVLPYDPRHGPPERINWEF